MANYAIMRIDKRKLGAVNRIGKHNERLKSEYKSNPDIDRNKSHLNHHLKAPTGSYRNMVLQRIRNSGARMRKDSVVLQDCFIGATPDWIRSKSTEEQHAYFETAFGFFEEKFGKENIISAVVHLDEATPHMHLCFVPITEDNRLSSKELIGGPKGLSKLQDEFYYHMHERFAELTRGTPKRVTKRRHIPGYLFKNAGQLYDHYNEILQAVNDIGILNNGKKKEEAISLLGRYAPEMCNLKDQLKATDAYITQLESSLSYERRNSREYREIIAEKDSTIIHTNHDLLELNQKQRELNDLISRIPPDLLEQIRQQELQERRERGMGWER